jgi:hypothetical protein
MRAKAPLRQFKSEAHRTAHDALVSMKVPSEEAHRLVHAQPQPDPNLSHDDAVSRLLFGALRQRASGQKRVQLPAGAPQNAVPLHPPEAPRTPPAPSAPASESTAAAAQLNPELSDQAQRIRQRWEAAKKGGPPPAPFPWRRAPIGTGGKTPTEPPSGAWQNVPGTEPGGGAVSATEPPQAKVEKPRIRMRLARGMPVAPIGAPPPAEPASTETEPQPEQKLPPAGPAAVQPAQKSPAAEGTAPEIANEEQYNRLAPGTLFRWMAPGPFQGRLFRAHVKGQPQT